MAKSLQFIADTIDGEIQSFPSVFNFPCDKIIPLGVNVVRGFDENLSIIAKRVFVVQYNNHAFGSSQFKSLDDFNQYLEVSCQCCPIKCVILVNGCALTLNGCALVLDEMEDNKCSILLNECNLTVNFCRVSLN